MKSNLDVSATGSLDIAPDAITVSFTVTEHGMNYNTVQRELNERVKLFRSLMEDAGFDRKDLITRNYDISPATKLDEDYNRIPNGFEGSHHLSIKIAMDQDLLDKLLRALQPALLAIPYSLNFGLMNRDEHRHKVMDIAVKRALADAEQLAKSAGVRLGPIVKLNFSEDRYSSGVDLRMMSMKLADTGPSSDFINPEVEPSDLTMSLSVHMQWRIIND
jgi:uncharacterized protein YggE